MCLREMHLVMVAVASSGRGARVGLPLRGMGGSGWEGALRRLPVLRAAVRPWLAAC